MTTHPLQLLAPARNREVALAAIRAGADAVYIGAPQFGAREKAGNSLEELAEVVREAHVYGVQVLVTLNTLLREDEYAQAVALARALYQIGVDALIIQDLHLLDFDLPPIRLHASTQCDNRTAEQVIRLQQMGFKRVVLARELGVDEIRAIRDAVAAYSEEHNEPPVELEAFIHGALCVSYSGRCYISEVLAGRSANRGACAQFCRMAYDLLDEHMQEVPDEQGRPIHQRHLLSLQDLDRSAHLAELIDAGVTTFKIEGRLKDADYVTNVTAYYRDLIDRFEEATGSADAPGQKHIYHRTFTPDPAKTFHRGGIDYFLHGRTPHMANWDTPKSTGEPIGEVLSVSGRRLRIRLRPGVELHNGDGLSLGSEGFSVNGVEGDAVLINKELPPIDLSASRTVYRNLDTAFAKSLHSERKIPVDILFRETADGFELRYTTFGLSERSYNGVFTCSAQPALHPEKALQTIRTQLGKLGDTPYVAREVRIESRPYFIPISTLNEWRRLVINGLSQTGTPTEVQRSPADTTGKPHGTPGEHGVQSSGYQSSTPLMTCRYCLLYELGRCRKTSPYAHGQEPRYLRLRNQTLLRLTFDCKNCQMLIDRC